MYIICDLQKKRYDNNNQLRPILDRYLSFQFASFKELKQASLTGPKQALKARVDMNIKLIWIAPGGCSIGFTCEINVQ